MTEPTLLLLGTIISTLVSATMAGIGLWLGRRERSATTQKLETETDRARRETEEIIWKRARTEIEKMAAELDALRRELNEERTARQTLETALSAERTSRQLLAARVNELERQNTTLSTENNRLRQNKNSLNSLDEF